LSGPSLPPLPSLGGLGVRGGLIGDGPSSSFAVGITALVIVCLYGFAFVVGLLALLGGAAFRTMR